MILVLLFALVLQPIQQFNNSATIPPPPTSETLTTDADTFVSAAPPSDANGDTRCLWIAEEKGWLYIAPDSTMAFSKRTCNDAVLNSQVYTSPRYLKREKI